MTPPPGLLRWSDDWPARNARHCTSSPPPGLPLTIAHKIGWGPCLLTQQARTMEAVRKFTLLEFRDERCFHLFGACRLGC